MLSQTLLLLVVLEQAEVPVLLETLAMAAMAGLMVEQVEVVAQGSIPLETLAQAEMEQTAL
jgi:hypothetical protein